MLQRLRSRLHGEEGFTLIELLVVILIIGILAAIAIPSFLNQKGKGEDASAKSGARTVQTAMETYYTDHNDYASCGVDSACDPKVRDIEPQIPDNADLDVSGNATGYVIKVTSEPSKRVFIITKTGATVARSCTVPSGQNNGGCVDGTSW